MFSAEMRAGFASNPEESPLQVNPSVPRPYEPLMLRSVIFGLAGYGEEGFHEETRRVVEGALDRRAEGSLPFCSRLKLGCATHVMRKLQMGLC